MCGIAAIVATSTNTQEWNDDGDLRSDLDAMLACIRTRGDAEHFGESAVGPGYALGTNRLAIVGRDDGRQPVGDAAGRRQVVLNGEIYNHHELRRELTGHGYVFATTTDTEVVLHGYECWGSGICEKLDGIFAFVVIDTVNGEFLAARDHIGIKPLYHTRFEDRWLFASEQKCLLRFGSPITTFPPGCFLDGDGLPIRYFEAATAASLEPALSDQEMINEVRSLLDDAVCKQVQTDLPVAVMFSGGIDSTIVLHLVRQHHQDVTAISVGMPGAADVEVARRYCYENGIKHIVYTMTEDELIEMLPQAVDHGEFFEGIDIIDTCIASFAYREANRHGFKVALCGEGSDEIFAGYDLFREHEEPETLMAYRVGNLHRTDLQRVDRAAMMNSVEARVPFLDKALLTRAYAIPMRLKLRDGVEKWVLRAAFRGILPDYIVDRPKVRMPDGSGVKGCLMQYADQPRSSDETDIDKMFDTNQSRYFLQCYLDRGFPMPLERHRRRGLDYSAHGYFNFVS